MRVGVAIVVVAGALLVFAVLRLVAFGSDAGESEGGPLPQVAHPEFCPRFRATRLPRGFTLRKRDTRNLGDGTIGRSYVYGDGVSAVEIHVGYDALDTYEDLDFNQRDVVVEGQAMTLHIPRALNGGFLAVTWKDPEPGLPSCAALTAIGRRVDERTLLDVAAGVERTGA